MSYKVYLCDSEDVFDIASWSFAKTENKIGAITKGEMFEMVDLFKDELQKAKKQNEWEKKKAGFKNDSSINPSGGSWSAQLQRKNFPSRWITYRHNRVLLKLSKDGTGVIVFSANPALEHLRVIPKTHDEFLKIAKEKEKKQLHRRTKQEVTKEEIKADKALKKKRTIETRSVAESYRQHIADIMGKDRDVEVTSEDVKGLEKKLEKKAEKILQKEEVSKRKKESKSAIVDLMETLDGAEEKVKKKIVKAIEDISTNKVADDALGENGFLSGEEKESPKTGDAAIDKKIDLVRAKIDIDDAIDIVIAKKKKLKEISEIKTKYQDDIKMPKGNVEITSLQGVAELDWNEPMVAKKEIAIEAALKSIETKNRAEMNTELYKNLEDREGTKGTQREMAKGAKDTINAMAGEHLEGASISDEIIEFVGVKNASRMIAGAVADSGANLNKTIKGIEKFLGTRSQDVVNEVVSTIGIKLERAKQYKEQVEEGMLVDASARPNVARQFRDIGREVGLAVGSLEAAATVLDSLKDVKESRGDVVVNGGKSIVDLRAKMVDFGLSEDDYFTKKKGKGYEVTIKHEAFDKMLSESTFSNTRNKTVEAIKTGAAIEGEIFNEKMGLRDYKPDGVAPTFTDWETKPKEGYTPYKNKKGEKGYTSTEEEGTTLYGKELQTGTMDSQQKAIKYTLSQKRTVWNLGAGTGKTFAYLGVVSDLKANGKMKGYALISPPSRLRNEFLNDTEKFFPHLKVAVLDTAGSIEKKMQMLKDAKDGKYDVIISGHDSVKSKLKNKELTPILNAKVDKLMDGWKKDNPDATPRQIKVAAGTFRGDLLNGEMKNYGLPNLIQESQPDFVAVDEAHEVFKSHTHKDSLKFSAIKKMEKDAEYVVNGTGTTVRNSMNELGNLLHVTNPSEFPSPSAFSKKYADVNQGSTVYQSQAAEAMAREYDNTMLTENLNLKPNFISKEHKINLSSEQKKAYADSERQYRLDRDGVGYGIIDNDTGNFVQIGDELKTYGDLGFKPTKDQRKISAKQKEFLKANGFKIPEKDGEGGFSGHSIVELGGKNGAAGRKATRHERVINGGDFKTNAKAKQMMDDIQARPSEEKHIIFYERHMSRNMLNDMVKELGYTPEQIRHIHGKVNEKGRKEAVGDFKKNDNVKIMLASEAGMTGLNMQKGDNIHFLTRSNTYAKQLQAIARAYRSGRFEDVRGFFHDSNTVVDNNKLDRLHKKKHMTEAIRETRDLNKRAMDKKLKKGIYVKF